MPSVSNLITEFNTKLQEVAGKVATAGRYAAGPQVLTAEQAMADYEIELPGEDYFLKLTPTDEGFSASYLTPDKWEITGTGSYISPEGTTYTIDQLKEMEASYNTSQTRIAELQDSGFYNQETGGYDVLGLLQAGKLTGAETEGLGEWANPEYWYGQDLTTAPVTIAPPSGEYETILASFGDVFDSSEIEQATQLALANPNEFISQIRDMGRSDKTEKLLRQVFGDVTDEQITDVFDPIIAGLRVSAIDMLLEKRPEALLRFIRAGGNTPENVALLQALLSEYTEAEINDFFATQTSDEALNKALGILKQNIIPETAPVVEEIPEKEASNFIDGLLASKSGIAKIIEWFTTPTKKPQWTDKIDPELANSPVVKKVLEGNPVTNKLLMAGQTPAEILSAVMEAGYEGMGGWMARVGAAVITSPFTEDGIPIGSDLMTTITDLLEGFAEWKEPVWFTVAGYEVRPTKGLLELVLNPANYLGIGGAKTIFQQAAKIEAKQLAGKTITKAEQTILNKAKTLESEISKSIKEAGGLVGERGGLKLPGGGEVPKKPIIPKATGEVPTPKVNIKETIPVDNLKLAIEAVTPETKSFSDSLLNLKNNVLREFYDNVYPLKQLERETGVDSWSLAKLFKGSASAGEDIIRVEVLPVIKPVAKDMDSLKVYMTLQRDLDILARNPNAKLPGGVVSPTEALAQLEAKLGAKRFKAIEDVAEKLYKLNDEWKLKPLLKEGIIDQATYDAIKAQNPHYIPFFRSDFTDDIVRDMSSGSASLSSTGIKTLELAGSERKLADPLANWMGQIVQVQEKVAKNKAARGVIDALKVLETKSGGKLIQEVGGSAEHSLITDTISFFENGVQKTLQVPKIYATAARNLDHEAANVFTKIMSIINAPLRYGAVTYNPGFLPVNMIRDATTAFFREKLIPFSPSYFKGWVAAATKNKTFQEVARGGALMSGIVDSMRSTSAIKVAASAGGIKINSVKDVMMLLPRLVEKANMTAEQATRIATYIKLRGKGVPEIEALVKTRDVTVDFAQMGTVMKVVNNIIPFSNASLQGTVNVARTVRDKPLWSLVASTPFAMATIMTRANNMRYETSKDIPYYEYTNYWVIQFGEFTEEDGTKAPLYFKIPKGQLGAILTFAPEAIFSYLQNTNNRSVVDILLEAGRSALEASSPVPTDIAGLLPSAISTGVELATGRNIYSGMPIVPRDEEALLPEQQYGTETSKIAIALGNMFNISPRLLDFALKDYTAGTGQAALWLTDLIIGAAGYNPEVYGSDLNKPLTLPEQLAKTPVVNRFIGVKSNQETREGWDNFDKMAEVTNREFAQIEEFNRLGIRLGEVGNSINGIELTPQEKVLYQRIMADIVIPGMQDALEKYYDLPTDELKGKLQSSMSSLKTKARGIYVLQSGNEKFINNWNDLIKQLGVVKYDAESDTLEPEPYNLNDLKSDVLAFLTGITSFDITDNVIQGKDGVLASTMVTIPDIVRTIVESRDIDIKADKYIKGELYKVGEDNIESLYLDGKLTQRQYVLLQEYYDLTTSRAKEKFLEDNPELRGNPYEDYLKANPEENAKLVLFGYTSKILTQKAYDTYQKMKMELDIPENALPDIGYLEDPVVARDYFKMLDIIAGTKDENVIKAYQDTWSYNRTIIDKKIVDVFSEYKTYTPSSPEAKYLRAFNEEFDKWGQEIYGWSPLEYDSIDALKLQYDFRKEYDEYGELEAKTEKEQYLIDHPEFARTRYLVEAYNNNATKEIAELFADYSLLETTDDKLIFRYEHPEFEEWGYEYNNFTPLSETTSVLALKIKSKNKQLTAEYNAIVTPKEKADWQEANPEYMDDLDRIYAYEHGIPENYIESYVEYRNVYDGHPSSYYDERWLKENQDYYNDVYLGILNKDPIDFDKVPTERWEIIYNDVYLKLPEGKARTEFRKGNKWFNDEGVKIGKWQPLTVYRKPYSTSIEEQWRL